MLAVLLAIAIGWIVRRRYRIPVIVIILGGFFIYGYLHTYLECNRVRNLQHNKILQFQTRLFKTLQKLEAEAMMEVMESNDDNSKSTQTSSFFNLFRFFSKESPEMKLKQKLL